MPYVSVVYRGLRVEHEHRITSIKVFDSNDVRLFSCEITTTSPDSARISSGIGVMRPRIWFAIYNWMIDQGFEAFWFERSDGRSKKYTLKR